MTSLLFNKIRMRKNTDEILEIGKRIKQRISDARIQDFYFGDNCCYHCSQNDDSNLGNLGLRWLEIEVTYGTDEANRRLDNTINKDKIEIWEAIWLVDITANEPLELAEDIFLMPIKNMPLNYLDTYEFLALFNEYKGVDLPSRHHSICLYPHSALIRKTFSKKKVEGSVEGIKDMHNMLETSQLSINDIYLLFSIMSPAIYSAYFRSSVYVSPDFMPFNVGRVDSYPQRGVYFARSRDIPECDINLFENFQNVLDAFSKMSNEDKTIIRFAINRMIRSKRAYNDDDKILDMVIALESLLLAKEKNPDKDIAKKFKTNGSKAIDGDETQENLAKMFKYRSKVAHEGRLPDDIANNAKKLQEKLKTFDDLAHKIIQAIILNSAIPSTSTSKEA